MATQKTKPATTKATPGGAKPVKKSGSTATIGTPVTHAPDHPRQLIKANLMALASIFVMSIVTAGLFWQGMSNKTEIIAVTEDARLIRPVPLPEAFVTEARVLGFVDECLRISFSHDFENFRRSFNNALPCYTSEGGKALAQALDPLLTDIEQRRIVMSTTAEPPALVRGPMLRNGRATWEVESVISMYLQGTRERFNTQVRLARVTVVRVPVAENPRGVAINSIQLSPYSRR